MADFFSNLGKLMGIEIKTVQDEPAWIPETPDQLRAITTLPTLPQSVWNVLGGGLNDGALVDTNTNILATSKLMRARLLHIRETFHAMSLPVTWTTYALASWIDRPKREAEQRLLLRAQRYQTGAATRPGGPIVRTVATPGNPYPVDFDFWEEVAWARNHIHTAIMWQALKRMAPPPSSAAPVGFVLPITAQERAVSEQAATERFREQRAISNPNYTLPPGVAVYPHQASPQMPARLYTYTELVDYAKYQYDAARWAMSVENPKRVSGAAYPDALAASQEWHRFWQALAVKWSVAALEAAEKQALTGAQAPAQQWMQAHEAQRAAWIQAHPEVRPELAHAKTLVSPEQRFMGGAGNDGTRLTYVA